MFDLDHAIGRWRVALAGAELEVEAIAELEMHLLDSMEDLASTTPLSEEERFLVAAHRLGHPIELGQEFERLTPWATWRTPILWSAISVAWVLGVVAIFEMAVPLGIIAGASLGITLGWVKLWAVLVYVGGPIVTFGSVALWMQRYSAGDPASGRAVLITTFIAALIRGLSVPLLSDVINPIASKLIRARSWYGIYDVWQIAALSGFVIVASVGAFAILRLHRVRGAPLLSV
jgi:hypothetical protein